MELKMIRNAIVDVKQVVEGTAGKCRAIVTIEDPAGNEQHQHEFPTSSRVSKSLDVMSVEQLSNRLSGGSYFFVDGQLNSWRDGNYHGFEHNDEAIAKLADVVGVTQVPSSKADALPSVILGKQWSEHDITIPQYNAGGSFESVLSFRWDPFSSNVSSELEIVRMICSNGMMGMAPFLNTKIPLINRWEEHLEIANRQIQNKVTDLVSRRLAQMGHEHASVGDLLLLEDHLHTRLRNIQSTSQREMLNNLVSIVSPTIHLSQVYRDGVFQDRRLASQVPGHLTTFDAYNITTEIGTHTQENRESTKFALDKLANALVFEHNDMTNLVGRYAPPTECSFSDPTTAFFGGIDPTSRQ